MLWVPSHGSKTDGTRMQYGKQSARERTFQFYTKNDGQCRLKNKYYVSLHSHAAQMWRLLFMHMQYPSGINNI